MKYCIPMILFFILLKSTCTCINILGYEIGQVQPDSLNTFL